MTWTQDRIDQLTRLWSDGLSCSLIGEAMGITRNAVIGKVHRLNLPPRRTTERASGWKWMHRPNRSQTRKSRAKPKPTVKVQRVTVPKPKPQPVEFTAETWDALPGSTPIPLMSLTDHTCKWCVVDPMGDGPTLFCGLHTAPGKSYCPEHQARSVGKGTAGEKSAISVARNYAMKEAA